MRCNALLITTTNMMLNDKRLTWLSFTLTSDTWTIRIDLNVYSTYQSRLGLIYTAWDALWCVWLWLHRSHSMMHTDRNRSKLNICIVDLWSCLLNMHHSWHLGTERWYMTAVNIKIYMRKILKSQVVWKINGQVNMEFVQMFCQWVNKLYKFLEFSCYKLVVPHFSAGTSQISTGWKVLEGICMWQRAHDHLKNIMQPSHIVLH